MRDAAPNCSDSLAALVARMLQKDPKERPTAEDVVAALNAEAIDSRDDEWSWQDNFAATKSSSQGSSQGSARGSSHGSSRGSSHGSSHGSHQLSHADASSVEDLPTVHLTGTHFMAPRTKRLLTAGIIAAVAIVLAVVMWPTTPTGPAGPNSQDGSQTQSTAWTNEFPGAPDSYGDREIGSKPTAELRETAPPFSWRHHEPPANVEFVADVEGRYFYNANTDPRADLIHHGQVKYFFSIEEAQASKWQAAPDLH